MPDPLSTPESPCGTPTEQLPQHILPSTKPQDQMLLEQDTFPAWEKSSCQLQPPVPPHTSTGWATGTIPTTESSCSPGRLKHVHGCTKELRAPQGDQPAMAGSPSGKDEIIIHCNGCYGSADAQPAPERPPLDHPTEHASGGAGSKWHWDHFSAMCSPRVGDSSPQIFGYSQP